MSEADTYRKLYVTESRENHEALVRNLLVLEKGSDDAAIDEIFRAAHTLKGMSASMGFDGMEHICHAMEDVFQLIRSSQLEVQQGLMDLLLSCTDRIEEVLDEIEAGGDGSSKSPDELVAALKKWSGGSAEAPLASSEPQVTPTLAQSDGTATAGSVPVYTITVTMAPSCTARNLRAMLVLQNLDSLGTICSANPAREVLEDGEWSGSFALRIESEAGAEALRTAASGAEIAEVLVASDTTAPAPASESPAPVPKAAPQKSDKTEGEKTEKTREVKNIRVDIARLDTMMNLVEDLVINRGRLKQIGTKYQIKELDEAINMVSRSVSDLQNLMMNIRMIPISHIFNRFPRVVRDVAHHDGKDVEFSMEGGDTELDRSIMDGLGDPLLHLIRNAVNHGIEQPDAREAAGKPRKGSVRLSARRDRDNVIIEITDDGAGINEERVLKKAVERGLVSEESGKTLTKDEIVQLLFQPGFSTAEVVTDISGRGVGLDVVRSAIESLKGTIRVDSSPGRGTTFQLILPPTMAIMEVMMVRISGRRCAIPINNVVEVASLHEDTVHRIGGREAIMLRNEVLPMFRLDDMFGSSNHREIIIVLQHQARKCCITASSVDGQQEVVIKPLSNLFGTCRGISGVTIPGDGEVVPVLDVNTMV